jgi:hypothetical protein
MISTGHGRRMRFVPVMLLILALILPGCASPAADLDTASAAMSVPVVVTLEIEHEGNVGLRDCAFCQGPFQEGTRVPLEFDGVAESILATVAWSAPGTLPLEQDLAVFLLVKEGESWVWSSNWPLAEGPSPLAFEWDLRTHGTKELALLVSASNDLGAPDFNPTVSTPREFQLTGTLAFLPRET